MDIKIGQVLEFVVPVHAGERLIAKGTRVRIAHILSEIDEPTLMVVVLGSENVETLILKRHEVTVNCRIVSEPAAQAAAHRPVN